MYTQRPAVNDFVSFCRPHVMEDAYPMQETSSNTTVKNNLRHFIDV